MAERRSLSVWLASAAQERLFGLSGPEGNHGEDVKEYYFYVDSTPTHSYMKMVYRCGFGGCVQASGLLQGVFTPSRWRNASMGTQLCDRGLSWRQVSL